MATAICAPGSEIYPPSATKSSKSAVEQRPVSLARVLTANSTSGIIENSVYRITMNTRGAITSIIDKTRANREFAKAYNSRLTNDLIIRNAVGTRFRHVHFTNAGPVSITLTATTTSPRNRTLRSPCSVIPTASTSITALPKILAPIIYWSFSFQLTSPDVCTKKSARSSGAYQKQRRISIAIKNGRYDGLTWHILLI